MRRSAGRRSLFVALAVVTIAASACRGSNGDVDLRFTREDGSVADFPESVRAWCGRFDEATPGIEGVHVMAGARSPEALKPFWVLRVVREDVEQTETVLPNNFVFEEPEGAALFALDDVEHSSNELSSADEESTGIIRVELEGCEIGDRVDVTLDSVTLGSELHDLPSMSVEGTVAAAIGEAP